jgi:DNA-binding MarR family transcriptional regulator
MTDDILERTASAPPLMLEAFLPYRLSVLSNTVSYGIERLYKEPFGLTVPEWRALALLGRFAPMTAGDIARRSAMDKVQVSRAVSKLVTNGLVTATQDTTDRRRTWLKLSAKGVHMHGEIAPLVLEREAALLEVLDAREQAMLTRLMEKLQTRAEGLEG